MPKVVKTQAEFEGRFFDQTIVVEGEEATPWSPEHQFSLVGKDQTRIDSAERVTGSAKFTYDVDLPGMLYGKTLRSTRASAMIKSVDVSKAESLPGVRAILHADNTDVDWRMGMTKLFDNKIRFAGDEIACVVADSEEICRDALDLIHVEYDEQPFVVDAEKAQEEGAPQLHEAGNYFGGIEPEVYERGDIEKALAEADVVVEGTYQTQVALHNCMETHGSVAFWEGEQLTIYDSTQHIYGVRDAIAHYLDMSRDKVRVIKRYMGGGFGSKNGAGKYTAMAAIAARRTGRPVKMMMDRREENLAMGNRASSVHVMKIGAKNDGSIVGIEHKATMNLGAFAGWLAGCTGPSRRTYQCPNVRAIEAGVHSNMGPYGAFRAPGYVEGTFALESMMDELAAKLELDPLELRKKNYAELDPITGKEFSTKGLMQAYDRGAELIGWDDRASFKSENSTENKKIGFGMGSQIWGGAGGPPAYALIKLNGDGSAVVITGTQEIGTGVKTALAMIASEVLSYPISKISVELGDTQSGVYAPLSAGSMTLASVGPAVRVAAEDAKDQLLSVGSQILDISLEDLTIENGDFVDTSKSERLPVTKIYEQLQNFQIIGKGARGPNTQEKIVATFGAQFARVEVDTETGRVNIQKLVAVHESGRVINPLATKSQLEGGIIQGIGFALTEQRFDDDRYGLVLNPSLETYKVPTMQDVPEIVTEMVDFADTDVNNLGSKGIGEPPIIPTPAAIANAVADAIGIRFDQLPLSPDRVLDHLNQLKASN
jgi:xanthine dehydrogenase YagR molybdenum-binding subunit